MLSGILKTHPAEHRRHGPPRHHLGAAGAPTTGARPTGSPTTAPAAIHQQPAGHRHLADQQPTEHPSSTAAIIAQIPGASR
jgi:hypothetical protein